MKLIYFDDFKLGVLKNDAVVDVSAARRIPINPPSRMDRRVKVNPPYASCQCRSYLHFARVPVTR
jgi:hypothetical protein